MRAAIGAFVVAVGLALGAQQWFGQDALLAQQTATGEAAAFAAETIAVSSTAIGPTAATVNPTTTRGASQMYCSVEAQPIRYRFDGTNPTALVGHPAVAGTTLTVTGAANITRFKAIKSGATDASVFCTYSR